MQANPATNATDKTGEVFLAFVWEVAGSVRVVGIASTTPELLRYRQLLLSLTWRDLRVRYKQSMLGIGWAVLLPLSMMLVFTFVFTRAIDASSVLHINMPYALYAYTGLVPWTFFSVSLGSCVMSLVANRNLVTKVYFPREVFPLSCVASSFVDFCIAMTVLVGLIAYFHWSGGWTFTARSTLLFVPVIVAVQIVLTVGVGMLLAMANLFYRDVRQVFSVVIQLWMFVSAVVVPVPQDGSWLARVIAINPLVPIFTAYRDCVIHGRWPGAGGFAYATVVALAVLVGGWLCFRRASHRFAECI
jgi:ABC-type polysaccharide/polyol phosphate export permease